MKRTLAAAMGLLMAFAGFTALAEAVEERGIAFSDELYIDGKHGYSVAYPAEWLVLSRESMSAILDGIGSGKIPGGGLASGDLAPFKEAIEGGDVVMFRDPQSNNNFNIVTEVSEQYRSLSTEDIFPAIQDYLNRLYFEDKDSFELLYEAELVDIDDRVFVSAGVRFVDVTPAKRIDQLFLCWEDALYTLTFTTDETDGQTMEDLEDLIVTVGYSFIP